MLMMLSQLSPERAVAGPSSSGTAQVQLTIRAPLYEDGGRCPGFWFVRGN
jgi:hypothetical protein